MTYFPVPKQYQAVHDVSMALTRSVAEGKARTDILKDAKKSEVESLDWISGGERIVSCTRDGALKIWSTQKLQEERSWAGSWTWAESHPTDPNVFCAVSWDGKLKVVDLRSAVAATDMDLKKSKGVEKFLAATWTLNGEEISVLTRTDVVHTVSIESAEVGTIQPGLEVYCIMYDQGDRLWVGTGGTPGRIMVYQNGTLVDEFVAHAHVTSSLTRTRDNAAMISGGGDALVALWDLQSNACVKTFPNSLSPVTTVSANADGSLVAWGSGAIGAKDGEPLLSIAGLQTGAHYLSQTLPGPVSRVKWHPSRNVIAYSMQQVNSADPSIQILSFPNIEQA